MTPRSFLASLRLARARKRRERADELNLATMAARGDVDKVQKQIRELTRE
jgi:hypothetical protein